MLLVFCRADGGYKPWGKPTAFGAKIDYWLESLLPLRKQRAVNNMLSWCRDWRWWFRCLCDWMARYQSWMIKNNNRTLYEALRQNRLCYTNMATETQTSLTCYGRRAGDSQDTTRFRSN